MAMTAKRVSDEKRMPNTVSVSEAPKLALLR